MRRVRIVYFVPYLTVGGVERQVQLLASGLDASRFEPIVWCSSAWGPIGKELRDLGVPALRIPYSPSMPGLGTRALSWLRLVRPAIFHSFEYFYTDYAGGWTDIGLARSAGIPVCLAARSDLRYWALGAQPTPAEETRNRLTDRIVCNSAAVADACVQLEGVSKAKIRIIRNGVALGKPRLRGALRRALGLPEDALVVGSVANLRPVKDYATLIAAFAKVAARLPKAYLIVCGDGPSRADVEGYIQSAGLRGRVLLLGACADPAAVFPDLDLSVHSSRSEGLPNAVLEAMAHGLPVVATDVGGTGEALQDKLSGRLVSPGHPGRLADAITEYLTNPTLRQEVGATARRRVQESFSLDRMVRDHEELYEECLRQAGLWPVEEIPRRVSHSRREVLFADSRS